MSVKQIVTIEIDYTDSISTQVRIVETPNGISLDDHAFLSYLMGLDVTEKHVELTIEPLEEAIQSFSTMETAEYLFIERVGEKLLIHKHWVSIDKISKEFFTFLLRTNQQIMTRNMMMTVLSLVSNNDTSRYTGNIVALGKIGEMGNMCGEPVLLTSVFNGKGEVKLISKTTYINSDGQKIHSTLVYLPRVSQVANVEEIISAEGVDEQCPVKVSFYNMDGERLDA